MNPSEATVLGRYLYPHTVHGVRGKDADIGHYQVLPFIDSKGVNRKSCDDLLRLLASKKEMLATGDEVETHMVVVGIDEIERVELHGVEACERVGTRRSEAIDNAKPARRHLMVATAQDQHYQHQRYEKPTFLHRRSSDSPDNQTPNETAVRRGAQDGAARATVDACHHDARNSPKHSADNGDTA